MKNKLVYGVGVNDADYLLQTFQYIGGRKIRNWICPYYVTWKKMLERCYSDKWHTARPRYLDCYVVKDWLLFSNFKAWMETQDWEGNHLDKDLLVKENKIYSPETCVFLTPRVNTFMVECTKARGDWPIGVTWNKKDQRFKAQCSNPFSGVQEYLGYFEDPMEAHKAWLKRKQHHAHELAKLQTDSNVAKALINRYSVEIYTALS